MWGSNEALAISYSLYKPLTGWHHKYFEASFSKHRISLSTILQFFLWYLLTLSERCVWRYMHNSIAIFLLTVYNSFALISIIWLCFFFFCNWRNMKVVICTYSQFALQLLRIETLWLSKLEKVQKEPNEFPLVSDVHFV